ncbi:MAG: hypothetical protein RH949_24275, partial [Coleofasciculus sp. A1-SPW-01]
FALITDFDLTQDLIELPANLSGTFSLGATPADVPQGTALFFDNDLIGVIAGITPQQLSLDSDRFVFV